MKTIEVTKPSDKWLKYQIVTESDDDVKALERVKQKYGDKACRCKGQPAVTINSYSPYRRIKEPYAECTECGGIVWVY